MGQGAHDSELTADGVTTLAIVVPYPCSWSAIVTYGNLCIGRRQREVDLVG